MPEIIIGRDWEDLEKYGARGTIFFGKHIVGTGEDAHLTTKVLVDVLRPHIITLCGKRGSGKCLLPETPVLLEDGSLKPIEKIFIENKKGEDNGEELYKVDKKIKVMSVDENLKIVSKPISHVYRKMIREKLMRIKTRTGKEITVTKEHPLLVSDSGLVWKKAGELKERASVCSLDGWKITHVLWDQIISIEEIDYQGYVYDLTVPETHNFVAGINGGIICHNSYSLGLFLEEMMNLPEDIKNNLCALMIDTQGIFWTMKSPNEQQVSLLTDWGIKAKGFPVHVYVPAGQRDIFKEAGVQFDGVFSVKPSQLTTEDWLGVFGIPFNDVLGILLQRTIDKMKKTRKDYSLDNIVNEIGRIEMPGLANEKLVLQNYFIAAKEWGIFAEAEEKMPVILEPGKVSILDVSLTSQNVRALLIALLSKHVLEERIKARRLEELAEIEETSIKRTPMCWILMDEAHNFLPPEEGEVQVPSSTILKKLVKEGRQPGITLVFATQRPEKLHPDALAQCDLVISHRLTSKADIDALRAVMQTYVLFDISKYLKDLPKLKGTAIVLDDNSERIYRIRARPRQSWHAGASPLAMRKK